MPDIFRRVWGATSLSPRDKADVSAESHGKIGKCKP